MLREVVEALRSGVVRRRGLELYPVGTGRFSMALGAELDAVVAGRAVAALHRPLKALLNGWYLFSRGTTGWPHFGIRSG